MASTIIRIDQNAVVARVMGQWDKALPMLWAFSGDTAALIDDGSFATVSRARSGARSYGYNDYDQIDLVDFHVAKAKYQEKWTRQAARLMGVKS